MGAFMYSTAEHLLIVCLDWCGWPKNIGTEA